MQITSITLCNFQCFGSTPVTVKLRNLTTFIGNNGCGKTAILEALCRLFGPPAERRLRRTDFHVPRGKSLEEIGPVKLYIECRINFPELSVEDDALAASVPECFRHMLVEEEDGKLFCRVRLEGMWAKAGLPEGEIEEDANWIKTAADEVDETEKQKMKSFERGRVLVLYVPAARDPARQLRNVSGTMLAKLLGAIVWSKKSTKLIEDSSAAIAEAFDAEASIKQIHRKIRKNWGDLYDEPTYAKPRLRPIGERVSEILNQIEMVFAPTEDGAPHDVEQLSEGQRSLFYLSLVKAIFDVEQEVHKKSLESTDEDEEEVDTGSISADRLTAPALTIFAVEEPENHLAPHYLGRIMDLLNRIAKNPQAQVILTTHSASALRRISPQSIRYIRLRPKTRTATVKRIKLPGTDAGDVHKYVKEAVTAYPELYFGRLVVLCEGDSEEIVLPRAANIADLPIDQSFASIVPLGGRHVNHFWRLLSDLKIPHLTLLDLDWGRAGGGWGRIKYAIKQLLAVGADRGKLLEVTDKDGKAEILSDEALEEMDEWTLSLSQAQPWLDCLEEFGVFFSAPLDIDLLMLEAQPKAYKIIDPGERGPNIPEKDPKRAARIAAALKAVLGEDGSDGADYTDEQKAMFPWYSYLFLGKGKPSTHIRALSEIEDDDFKKDCPAVLVRLVKAMKRKLRSDEE